MGIDSKSSNIILIFQYDALCTRPDEAWHTEKVVHRNGQMMSWERFLHQDVGTVLQEIKTYALERDVVGISI